MNLAIVGFSALLLGGTSLAQGIELSDWDRNDDHLLSREELILGSGGGKGFERLDLNNDELIDASEWSVRDLAL
jgi:hypothetical protein